MSIQKKYFSRGLAVFFITLFIFTHARSTPCDPGTFSDDGEAPCEDCPTGTFQDLSGANQCTDCPAGRYQDETGKSTCDLCDQGTYTDDDGNSSCTNCEAGFYQSSVGSTICNACEEDTISSTEAATECTECFEGSYAESASSECNSECGDEIIFEADEECDDGNIDDTDGCSSTCAYETNSDLETSNSSVDFSELSTNQPLSLSSPHASSTGCTCTWALNPTSAGTVSGSASCRKFVTLTELGQANLSVEENCTSTGVATLNQTMIITTVSESSGGCSLVIHQ